jgi:hypothetical protein
MDYLSGTTYVHLEVAPSTSPDYMAKRHDSSTPSSRREG